MKITPIKTRVVKAPKDNIYDLFDNLKINNGDIVAITSKIVSIHQGRCVPINSINKDELIKKEADYYIDRDKVPGKAVILTIKNSTLIASAGIDENKNAGYYILLPQKPELFARDLCRHMRKKYNIKKLAVIVVDSHTAPLRIGVSGISIGFFGLEPFRKYFDNGGEEILASRVNIVDSLAAVAVFEMGEQAEQTPISIIRDANLIKFTNKETYQQTFLPLHKDIYYPLYEEFQK